MTLISMLAGLALAGSTIHELEVSPTLAAVVRTDRLISPRAYTGVAPGAALAWNIRGPSAVNHFDLSVAIGDFRSGPDFDYQWSDGTENRTEASPATLVDIQYAHGRRLRGKGWTLHVGATSSNHVEDITHVIGFLGLKTYLGLFEFGPWAEARVDLHRRHALELEVWSPVITWVSRNDHSVHDGDYIWHNRDNNTVSTIVRYIGDGSVQSVNHYQAAHVRLGWTAQLNDRFSLLLHSRVDALHYSEPRSLVQLQFGAQAGLRGSF